MEWTSDILEELMAIVGRTVAVRAAHAHSRRCRHVSTPLRAATARAQVVCSRAITSARRSASAPLKNLRRSLILVRAEPESPVEEAIKEAVEVCDTEDANKCAEAWDEVEELSAAAADARQKAKEADPLEKYCEDSPDADECRVYED